MSKNATPENMLWLDTAGPPQRGSEVSQSDHPCFPVLPPHRPAGSPRGGARCGHLPRGAKRPSMNALGDHGTSDIPEKVVVALTSETLTHNRAKRRSRASHTRNRPHRHFAAGCSWGSPTAHVRKRSPCPPWAFVRGFTGVWRPSLSHTSESATGHAWVHVKRLRGAGCADGVPFKTVFGRDLAAVVERKNSMLTLFPFAGTNDLVKGRSTGGIQSFVVPTPHDGDSTGFRAVLGEVPVAALGTTLLVRWVACCEWARIFRTPLRIASKSSPLGLELWLIHLCPW